MEKQPILFYLDLEGCQDVAAFRETLFSNVIEPDNAFLDETPFVLEETTERAKADVVYLYENENRDDAFAADFLKVAVARAKELHKQSMALAQEEKLQEAFDVFADAFSIFGKIMDVELSVAEDEEVHTLSVEDSIVYFEYALDAIELLHRMDDEENLQAIASVYEQVLADLHLSKYKTHIIYRYLYEKLEKVYADRDAERAEEYKQKVLYHLSQTPKKPIRNAEGEALVAQAWEHALAFDRDNAREYYIDAQDHIEKSADLFIEALERGFVVDRQKIYALVNVLCPARFAYEDTWFPRLLEAYRKRSEKYDSERIPYSTIYVKVGNYYAERNEKKQAREAYHKAQEILNMIDSELFDPTESLQLIDEALEKVQDDLPQLEQEALALLNKARELWFDDKEEEAMVTYLRAEELYKGLVEDYPDYYWFNQSEVYTDLAMVAEYNGDSETEWGWRKKAAACYEEYGDSISTCCCAAAGYNYLRIAELNKEKHIVGDLQKEYTTITNYFVQAIENGHTVSPDSIRRLLYLAGDTFQYFLYEDTPFPALIEAYKQGIEQSRKLKWNYAKLFTELGKWYTEKKEIEKAKDAFVEAVQIYAEATHEEQPDLQEDLADVMVLIGDLHEQSDPEQAVMSFENAAGLYADLKRKRDNAVDFDFNASMALLYYRAGMMSFHALHDRVRSFKNLKNAVALLEVLSEEDDEYLTFLGDALFIMGYCMLASEDKLSCIETLRKAKAVYQKTGTTEGLNMVNTILAESFNICDE